ncbi:MAG: aminomethyl-transferring glycine dehydrogenase subunit GcvPA [Candidatus Thermoplasmatota archaeon]|nr:aminomethyl-transferring glycine dehydrogenase subunit GcvPA [Thermoplasmatales archaeon]
MKFIPNSSIKQMMLKEIGLNNIEELFYDIPKKIRINDLNLPNSLTQQETFEKLREISNNNKSYNDMLFFIGGGIKPHFIPSVVKAITSRSEFFTAYTPYQSEASQGFLQAMFEYQSIIAELTGLDVANCSLYDGVTALSEAALMCCRVNKKKTILIPKNISWEKKSVLQNYAKGPRIQIKEIKYDDETGMIDIENLKENINKDVSGIYIENPNFFGIFEDNVNEISKIVKESDSLFVVGIDPISLGITKSPGEYGADISIGEGRSLGNPMNFGGSSLGIFSCKKEFLRQIPGRIIGMTRDKEGNQAFSMALQTREQHIRRGKATSNICTNEGLCALAAVTYIAWLGCKGFENLSKINLENGQKLAKNITSLNGFEKKFKSFHFNEFVIKSDENAKKINRELLKRNIQGGYLLEDFYPNMKNCILFGTSELHDDKKFEILISSLKEVSNV